jgi:hypothetical protein
MKAGASKIAPDLQIRTTPPPAPRPRYPDQLRPLARKSGASIQSLLKLIFKTGEKACINFSWPCVNIRSSRQRFGKEMLNSYLALGKRESDLHGKQKFRLSAQSRREMLASSSSHHDPKQALIFGDQKVSEAMRTLRLDREP